MENFTTFNEHNSRPESVSGLQDTITNEIDLHYDESSVTHSFVETLSMYTSIDPIYFYYYLWILAQLLQGPWAILTSHAPYAAVVLKARLTTLIVDLVRPGSQVIKDFIVILFGMHQLVSYLNQTASFRTTQFMLVLLTFYCILLTILSWRATSRSNPCDNSESSALLSWWALVVILMPIFLNEYFIFLTVHQDHTYLRSILMVLTMKVIRISERKPVFSDLPYLIHPASTIFGLWHSSEQTSEPRGRLPRSQYLYEFVSQSRIVMMSFAKVLLVLVILVHFPDALAGIASGAGYPLIQKSIQVYSVGQEFRFSHYFTMLFAGSLLKFWMDPTERNPEVCHIVQVELPRSLVQVVVSWNIPMHTWLKDHVFKPIKLKTTSVGVAIVFTYLMSSMLHGFKFHIWSVLLTLGLLTWNEHRIRVSLARRLGACILARKCTYSPDGRCLGGHHRTTRNSLYVNIINFCFSIAAMVHLAFLGYIFQGNTDEANYRDAMNLWSELYFYSFLAIPIMMFAT